MRRWLIAAVALLPSACGRVADVTPSPDATYTLKMYEAREGDVCRVTKTRTADMDATATAGHRGGTNKGASKEKAVYTEEVLARADGRTTRLRRGYEAVEKTDLKGAAMKSHLVGQTVQVDLSGPKPKYQVDGQPATADQAKELDAEFGRERKDGLSNAEMLPDRPVKVGETWVVDRAKVAAGLPEVTGAKFERDQARLSGKLVSVTHLGGKPRAKVEFTLRVPISEFTLPGQRPLKTDGDSSMTLTSTVEFYPDGATPGHTTFHNGRGRIGADLPSRGLFTYHYQESGTLTEEPATK